MRRIAESEGEDRAADVGAGLHTAIAEDAPAPPGAKAPTAVESEPKETEDATDHEEEATGGVKI